MVGILQANIFTNKTALITGAASGIGRGLALHAAKLQMNVVLMDLNADGLNETHSLMADCPCLLYTSPSPRDGLLSRMPSSA